MFTNEVLIEIKEKVDLIWKVLQCSNSPVPEQSKKRKRKNSKAEIRRNLELAWKKKYPLSK